MPPGTQDGTEFGQYKVFILKELDRYGADLEALAKKIEALQVVDIAQIRTDIALLKLQAALWGAVAGGALTAVIGVFSKWVT